MDDDLIPQILSAVRASLRHAIVFPGPKFTLVGVTGIVHVYAQWSGEAITAWSTLTTVLSESRPSPIIYVVLSDYGAEFMISTFNEVSDGYGATYWVKDGHVIQKLHRYDRATPGIEETIKAYTDGAMAT